MKKNYEKHIEQMENWKDIAMKKDLVSKIKFVPLFLMEWEAPMM